MEPSVAKINIVPYSVFRSELTKHCKYEGSPVITWNKVELGTIHKYQTTAMLVRTKSRLLDIITQT